MNSKEIFDVKKGSDNVSALMLGEGVVWRRNYAEDMPDRGHMLVCYDAEKFKGNTYPQNYGSGKWLDGVSGKVLDMEYCRKRTVYRRELPGVAIRSSEFNMEFDESLPGISYYFRIKNHGNSTSQAVWMSMRGEDGLGFSIFFAWFATNLYIHTTPTASLIKYITTDNYAYHTIAVCINESKAYIYLDGELLFNTGHRGYKKCLFIDTKPTYAPVMMQKLAIYSTCHDQATVKAISDHINAQYEIEQVPESSRYMIYNKGEQYDSLTGGWVVCPEGAEESVTFDDNNIILKTRRSSGVTYTGACQTALPIDLSGYSRLCFKLAVTATSGVYGCYFGYRTSSDGALNLSEMTANQLTSHNSANEADAVVLSFDLPEDKSSIIPVLYDNFTNYNASTYIYSVWAE